MAFCRVVVVKMINGLGNIFLPVPTLGVNVKVDIDSNQLSVLKCIWRGVPFEGVCLLKG